MKKILIFSNGEQIGDGILKLQIVHQLRERFPTSEIHWMTDTIYTEYNSRLKKFTEPYIDRIWEQVNLSPFFWKRISSKYDISNINFDIIIDTQKAVLRTIALRRIKCSKFISASANWMFSNYKPKDKKSKRQFYINNIIEMLDLVSSYKKQQASSITIPKEILKELQEVFQADKKYFGISLGSNTPKRIWDYKKFIDVAKYFEAKGFEIVFFLGPQETHLKEDIINQIKKPMFPEEELSNFPGLEVVMGATKYLSMAITNDSGTGQMLSTNLCPLLKICGPTSAVKFLNDQFENIHFISSVKFGGSNINLISADDVIKESNKILQSSRSSFD